MWRIYSTLTPRSLATNARASIELLPGWRSFAWVQRDKDLLVAAWAEYTVPTDRLKRAGRAR